MADDNPACCPKCGSQEVQPAGILKRRINPWVAHFGRLWLSLLWSGSRKEQVRCVQCDTLFEHATRASKTARVALTLFLLLILLSLLAQLSGMDSGLRDR